MGMTPKEIAAWVAGLTGLGAAGAAGSMVAAAEDEEVEPTYRRPEKK